MSTFVVAKAARQRWIDVLLRGDFKQAKGKLATENYTAFCCLGVAEETIGPDLGIKRDGLGIYAIMTGESKLLKDTVSGMLHSILRKHLGLTHHHMDALTTLNDNGASFIQIAEVIRLMEYYCDDGIFSCLGVKLGIPVREL